MDSLVPLLGEGREARSLGAHLRALQAALALPGGGDEQCRALERATADFRSLPADAGSMQVRESLALRLDLSAAFVARRR